MLLNHYCSTLMLYVDQSAQCLFKLNTPMLFMNLTTLAVLYGFREYVKRTSSNDYLSSLFRLQ